MSNALLRWKGSWPAWVFLVALLHISIGCFNGNGNGMRDRGPRGGDGDTSVAPTAADLAEIRSRLEVARATVPDLPLAEQGRMRQALDRAEAALAHYERLAHQGAARQRRTGQIYMAGGFVMANDATGIGR